MAAKWTDSEKITLFAEILKEHRVPPSILYGFLREANIDPNWNEIPLPLGRSLSSCQAMYQDMAASYSPEARGVTQRTVPRPTNGPPKTIPQKRPHPEDPAAQPQGARHLQPKPSAYSLNGADDAPAQGGFDPSASTDSTKRKRGRPTKAEAERKRQEAEARGEQYPPAPKIPKTPTMTAASGLLSNLPGSGGSPGSVLGSGGTPGKRRRGRPTKAEAAAKKALLDIAYDAENPSKAAQQTEGAEGEEGEEGEDVEQMLRDEMEMEHSHTIGGGPTR